MIGRPQVSDHALVRYLERVYGLPVEEVREEIAARLAERVVVDPRESQAVHVDGHVYQLVHGRVVTVLPARAPRRVRRRVPGELPEGDPRKPGSRPATDGDPWWWAMSGGWDFGSSEGEG